MRNFYVFLLTQLLGLSACAQPAQRKAFSMPCEGCEAIYESPVPFEQLNAVDTLPDFSEAGPKMLVTGVIYEYDGKTPARNVVLYIYHTDQRGLYATRGGETGWVKRHGYIRGWIRTGADGRYAFYTLRPAAYPNDKIPAHIHPVIREADMQPYYVDEWLFDDDPLLTPEERAKQPGYGGSGIVRTSNRNDLLIATRDIVLGAGIPGYPIKKGL
ncbi:hypothetical protein [Paraflavitalea pollutisoli]|uniref:dioxygenase family protein n=1 Tax=Paraflavitalea pollutisoli TaxID=3034143 RepID=UPI0023EBD9E8|nr:hypothetical protein [Paraflavitalea sp. H1-2-19X]